MAQKCAHRTRWNITYQVAAALELRKKRIFEEVLGALRRQVDSSPLDEMRRAGLIVGIQTVDVSDNILRANRSTQSPASHAEGLGVGVQNDSAGLHALERHNRLRRGICNRQVRISVEI